MGSLDSAIPGWNQAVTMEFAARVAAGCARESARLRGHSHVLALALSTFDFEGLSESVELLQPIDDLQEGAVRAEAEARLRGDRLREEHGWHDLAAGGARALGPFREAPFLTVRKVGDGGGFNSIYVQVAVLPLDAEDSLNLAFVRRVGMDWELATWFEKVATKA
jgi:hypothetical protein